MRDESDVNDSAVDDRLGVADWRFLASLRNFCTARMTALREARARDESQDMEDDTKWLKGDSQGRRDTSDGASQLFGTRLAHHPVVRQIFILGRHRHAVKERVILRPVKRRGVELARTGAVASKRKHIPSSRQS